MKKRYKHIPRYSPARGENRHLNARVPGSDTPMWLLTAFSLLAQKEAANDLHFLSPQRAVQLFGDYRRGMMADVQRIFDQLEQYDDALFTSVRARQAALEAMPWSIVIDSEAVGDSPKRQQLAEAQKDCLGTLLGNVENFEEAYVHLGKADFAGVAALDLTGNDRRMRWEPMEPWCLARPSHALPWAWNAQAELNPPTLQDLDPDKVIIREAYSIDLVALFLICSKYHAEKAWDAFLDMFGNPSIFLEMPGATSQDQAAQYDALVRRLIGEGRGTIPQGAKFQTVETARDNSAAFQERAKWCREAIITIATGGTLTVTSEAGSGTLAGNAHEDSFDRLAAASALSITRAINRQFCRRKLLEKFPGEPILAAFELAPEKPDDRAAQAQIIATLAGAGFKPSAETVSEMMGFEVAAVEQQPDLPLTIDSGAPHRALTPLGRPAGVQSPSEPSGALTNSAPVAQAVTNSRASDSEPNSINGQWSIVNGKSPESAPLSEIELNALQALASGGLSADALHAPGNALADALQDAVITNGCNKLDCDKHPHNRQEERAELKQDRESMRSAGFSEDEIERALGKEPRMRLSPEQAAEVRNFMQRCTATKKQIRSSLPEHGGLKLHMEEPSVAGTVLTRNAIGEMLTRKAVAASVHNGCPVAAHVEAVERAAELASKSKKVGEEAGRKENDSISKITHLETTFQAKSDKQKYTAHYTVQHPVNEKMPPQLYFLYLRK